MKFLIITPVRNEEAHIQCTIRSVCRQTFLPEKWVIVDDGSKDKTGSIVRSFLAGMPFAEYLRCDDRGYREPGKGVVDAFYTGFDRQAVTDFDVIAKMDGDLEFGPECFQILKEAFENDSALGIAGGVRLEKSPGGDSYKEVLVPRGFVGGPFKFYRTTCFADIQGLCHRAGWDGVDIVRARMKGWSTREIRSLKYLHLRPTGTASGEGLRRACEKYGDISYFMGGYLWYFFLRAFGRSLLYRNPRIACFMFKGYFRSRTNHVPRESPEFRAALRLMQRENMTYWIRRLLNAGRSEEDVEGNHTSG